MRILLVRLRQIGDVVFTTPAVRALRERFPDAQISYLVEPAAAPILALNPHLDEVIVAPRLPGLRGFAADLALGRRLRRAAFDLVIDFHGGPRASLLTWLTGAPERIGYTIPARSWMYTRRVHRTRELRPRHSVENQWDLLEQLGVPAADRGRFPVEMPVDPAAAGSVRARLERAGVPPSAQLIVIHVSAGNPFRRWPLDAFAKVAADIARADDTRHVVFTCGPSEREALARVIAAARACAGPDAGNRILDCGDFSLPELRALVDRAHLYVGGDSGPMHVAATSVVPMVSLYGPTLPARSEPWRDRAWRAETVETSGLACRPCDQRICVHGDFRCLGRIPPEAVVAAAERLLGQNG
jgi:predicted lipopolysaccharide heptosyltransferase III